MGCFTVIIGESGAGSPVSSTPLEPLLPSPGGMAQQAANLTNGSKSGTPTAPICP
jgi:hypothetical protein